MREDQKITTSSGFVTAKNHKIHYVRGGSGPILVFIPGFGSNHKTYMGLLRYLGENFDVVILDPPGYGLSQRLNSRDNYLANSSAILAEAINELHLKDYILMGYSMGAALIHGLLHSNPSFYVKNLVFFEPFTGTTNLKFSSYFIKLMLTCSKFCTTRLPVAIGTKIWSSERILRILVKYFYLIEKERPDDQKINLLQSADFHTFWKSVHDLLSIKTLMSTENTVSSVNTVLVTSSLSNTIKYAETISWFKAKFNNLTVVDTKIVKHFPIHPLDEKTLADKYSFLKEELIKLIT